LTPRALLLEAVGTFAAATATAALLYRLRFLDDYFHAAVAFLFLYLPAMILWRRGLELDAYGLTRRPLGRNLLVAGVCVLVVLPLFAVGFIVWQRVVCAPWAPSWLTLLAAGPCPSVTSELSLRLPPKLWRLAAAELLVVALPEEFFFRGYLQGRLSEVWPKARKLFGVPVGKALLLQAALFAICHLAVQGHPATLAVFFPGLLFGWLRGRTGSILPGVLFHAACNLYIEVLHRSVFAA
jgi:uncharacterized protein